MAVGSARRREERRAQIEALFGPRHTDAALDLLHLADLAWHDCYREDLELRPDVLADILLLSRGDLAALIRIALSAIEDFRDVRVAADEERANQSR